MKVKFPCADCIHNAVCGIKDDMIEQGLENTNSGAVLLIVCSQKLPVSCVTTNGKEVQHP
jgi:hypothetical protein